MRHYPVGIFRNPSTDIAVITTDMDGNITVFNRCAENILGYNADEMIGKKAPVTNFEEILSTCENFHNIPQECTFVHKNGETIPLELILSPIRNNDGRTTGLLFTASRIRAEQNIMQLSDLPTREVFEIVLDRELRRAQRQNEKISVIAIDMDHYKKYVAHYGNAEAQICLTHIASVIQERIQRAGDFYAFGGVDDFFILLPSTDRSGAVKVCEQLRLLISNLDLEHAGCTNPGIVTISLGIGTINATREVKKDDLMQLALSSLQKAKKSGRNCTRFND